MGLVGESLGSVSSSLAEVESNGEGSGTGRDVDGRTTGKVEGTESTTPTVGTPSPGGDGTVDDGQPDKDKDHDGSDSCSFSETTNGEDDSDERKHALVGGKDDSGESSRSGSGFTVDTHQAKVFESTDESGSSVRDTLNRRENIHRSVIGEGQRVTPEEPLE